MDYRKLMRNLSQETDFDLSDLFEKWYVSWVHLLPIPEIREIMAAIQEECGCFSAFETDTQFIIVIKNSIENSIKRTDLFYYQEKELLIEYWDTENNCVFCSDIGEIPVFFIREFWEFYSEHLERYPFIGRAKEALELIQKEFGDLSEEEMTEFLFTLKTMIDKKLDEEN